MPRSKQPQSLRSSSLHALANVILDACEKSDGKQQEKIQQYVKDIPNTFANEFVNEVLQLHSRRSNCFDITSALHPKCTGISEKCDGVFFSSPDQLLKGLQVMSDLINIEPEINLEQSCEKEGQGIPFPKMTNLRSIKVSLDANRQLLPQVIENCPNLQDIVIDNFLYGMGPTPSILRLLSKCKNLKKISVHSLTPEIAIHLLDHLPNLEVLQMDHILEVLPLCTHAYKLKDFAADLDATNIATLQKVVTHFPYLEKLDLYMVDNAHINMISGLANLKSLKLCNGTSSNLLFLMDKCMFGLHQLQLEKVAGLDSLFRQNMNVSYPKLESLTIENCTGINVAGIREIFPDLKCLELLYGDYVGHSLPCKMPHAGSQALEELNINNVPVQQVRYLIPFCSKLKCLFVDNTSVKSCVYELLCNANLKELRTLYVCDNSMKREVIPIVFDSCGEHLERVHLYSSKLILLPDYLNELSHQLEQYDMHFFVNHTKISSLNFTGF